MYRRRKEKRQRFIQSVIWWHPLILVLLMFILGACTNTAAKGYTMAAADAVQQDTRIADTTGVPKAASTAGAAETAARTSEAAKTQESGKEKASAVQISENGNYTSRAEVALYIHTYGKLPSNYITKQQAERKGWDSKKGNLSDILPGMSIGGSVFGNYEGLLPAEKGRKYYECDIDYNGGYRNAKRIIYSNDGLVFYTEDHYKTFEQLY